MKKLPRFRRMCGCGSALRCIGFLLLTLTLVASGLPVQQQQQSQDDDAGEVDFEVVANQVGSDVVALFEAMAADVFNDLQRLGVVVIVPELVSTASTFDYKVSLNLGIVVADALSSAINRDRDAFLARARLVHEYAQRLGVQDQVLRKYVELQHAVANSQWQQVERLIYALKDNISDELQRVEMTEYAVLAMVAGWLEGLHIVAASLTPNFPATANTVLRDRDFVRYLQQHLDALPADFQARGEIRAILEALPQIDRLINRDFDYVFSGDDAAQLLQLTAALRRALTM